MSYCRWSTDDFQCDLYCYESAAGYVTHVACKRPVYKEPLPPQIFLEDDPEGWLARHRFVMDLLDTVERVGIGLPYDGQTFTNTDLEEFLATLLRLKQAGYRFPDYVIEAVMFELSEAEAAAIEQQQTEGGN